MHNGDDLPVKQRFSKDAIAALADQPLEYQGYSVSSPPAFVTSNTTQSKTVCVTASTPQVNIPVSSIGRAEDFDDSIEMNKSDHSLRSQLRRMQRGYGSRQI